MSSLAYDSLLAEIESRAGASDQDREAWLAERVGGVTATQIRDMYLWEEYARNGGEKPRYANTASEILLDKLGVPIPFTMTKYVTWGNTREPVIAQHVEDLFSIRPEHRVFRAVDNPRHLASPDGIGESWDGLLMLGEYKTTNKPIPVGSPALVKKGYIAQMVWCMYVLGADDTVRAATRCLYSWEQHNDEWLTYPGVEFPEPAAIVQHVDEWVSYDGVLAERLVGIASRFLDALDDAKARVAAGEEPIVAAKAALGEVQADPDDYEDLAGEYLAAVERRDRADARIKELGALILARAGDQVDPIVTSRARIAFVRPQARRGFDEAAWARRAPKAYAGFLAAKEKYVKLTPVAASVRVTALKEES